MAAGEYHRAILRRETRKTEAYGTIDARMAAYKEQAALNPNKRGPKPQAAKKR